MPDRSKILTPLDVLWQAPVIVWAVLAGEGLAIVLTLASGLDGDPLTYFGLASLIIQWIALLTLGALYLFRRLIGRLRPQYVSYVAMALLILTTWLVCAAVWLVPQSLGSFPRASWLTLFLQFTGIAITVGMLGLAVFHNHWRTRQLAVLAKQSELEALQARIRPHFLFNTLNTGAALVHQRPADAEQLLLDLADLFRAALGKAREIPLEEELALTRRYLEIESLRFGERLQVLWNIPATLPEAAIPALSIQPLAENAIKHGVEPSPSGGRIEIEVAIDTNIASITIRNTLPAADAGSTAGHNIGLNSVRARLQAALPYPASLDTRSDGQHYIATILLPIA
ncbi:MAG TPA: histidine kinase [Pseudoxanthomonas sp.]